LKRAAYGLKLCMEFTIKKINKQLKKVLFFLVVIQTIISIFDPATFLLTKRNLK